MARYTINYTKKNSFMKEPRLKQVNLEGEVVQDTRYLKPTVPKAVRYYSPHLNYRTGVFAVNLDQKSLNELVEKIGFYDDNNNLITTAPLNNSNGSFWKHRDLRIVLAGSGTSLDDDNPLDKFWLKCFEADYRFKFSGEDLAPSVASRVEFSVMKVTEQQAEQTEADKEYELALELYFKHKNDHEKLTSVLRAMGTDVRNPEPELVRRAITRKINEHKDLYAPGSSERNIELFIRLISSASEDLALKDIVNKAKQRGVIKKDSGGRFTYGDIKLGTSLLAVEEYLKKEDNSEILNEFITKTK